MNASSKANVTGTSTSRPKYRVATIITNSVIAFDGSGAAAGPTGFGGGAANGDVSDMVVPRYDPSGFTQSAAAVD
jgi:hypothetical protein